MKLVAAGLALGPLLVVQGRRVRRVALRLPEPEGPRQGVAGAAAGSATRSLRLLVVGDSSAAGVGAPVQAEALVGRLAEALLGQSGVEPAFDRVEWRLEARTGATVADVLAFVEAMPAWSCDVAVVAVGVNDVTAATPIARWLRAVDRLVDALRRRNRAACVILSGLPPMHRFPLLPQPLRWYLGAHARRFDDALARRASSSPAVRHVRLPVMSDPSMIAADGFHPSPAGYRVWADALAAELARAAPSRSAGSPASAASASTK